MSRTPADHPLPRRRSGWLRTLLLGSVILLSGMIIGSGLTLHVIWNRVTTMLQHPDAIPERWTERLQSRLDLTPEQAERIEQIMRERQEALRDLRREWQPLLMEELDRLQEEVAAVLDEEQARKWNERCTYLREHLVPPLPE
jgi:hypothetical protein